MPRYTNKKAEDQGTGQSSAEMLADQGLSEQPQEGIGTESSVIPKTTAATGTNIVPPRFIVPNQDDFNKVKLDFQIDPSFTGKMTIVRSSGSPGVRSYIYTGPQLVDENGRLSGGTYSGDGSDIATEFFGVKTAAERQTMISTAQKLGFFYGSKPSAAMLSGTGMDAGDRRAVQDLLDYSVRVGRTWRSVSGMLASGQISPASGGGGGASYSVVSTEDAMDAVREEFFRVLKRPPTPAEARQAALNIQQAERSRASGGSMDPTSLGVAARSQAEQAAPGEFAANAAGSAMTRIFALLGGQ
jgi:hypothetical protein